MLSGCVQLTYVPADLGVDVDVLLNGNNLYHTSLSGKRWVFLCLLYIFIYCNHFLMERSLGVLCHIQ
jgi:hypothetical protein